MNGIDGNARPGSYADVAQILHELPVILRSARRMRRLSQRAAGQQIGISFTTVNRIEEGRDVDSGTLLAVLKWLDATGAGEPVQEPGHAA